MGTLPPQGMIIPDDQSDAMSYSVASSPDKFTNNNHHSNPDFGISMNEYSTYNEQVTNFR